MIVFVVTGRLGKSLVESKVLPITNHHKVEKVFVFSETKGYDIPNAEYITLPLWLNNFPYKSLKKLIRCIYEPIQLYFYAKRYQPFLINGIYTLPKGLNAMIVSKLVGCKSMVSVIGGTKEIPTYMKPTFFWKNLNLWLLRNTDAVSTKGSVISEYLISLKIENKKIFEFGGGLDKTKYQIPHEKQRTIDILFVGNYSPLKGPDRVLSIIKKLKLHHPEIRASFLGQGPLFNQVNKFIIEDDLTENIRQHGQVVNTVDFFQNAKLLIMPSISEGLSTAMLEAMSCGCVAIVSNVGTMCDAAIHNTTAMLVDDYNNIDLFYEYAENLLNDEEKRNSLAQNAKLLVIEKYSIESQTLIFNNILNYLYQS